MELKPTPVCRPVLDQDTEAVLELCSHIWEGEDYIPYVWQDWLVDQRGFLAAVEYGERLAGLCRLVRLSEGQWWLEGMRVHPDLAGRGIGSHLHAYMLERWQGMGGGVIRLATMHDNVRVHRICARTNFQRLGEITAFRAPALAEPCDAFRPLSLDETLQALACSLESPGLNLSYGMYDLGWQWCVPDRETMAQVIRAGRAWWWRHDQGLLLLWEDQETDEFLLVIQLAACPLDQQVDLLLDFRRLAARLGSSSVEWNLPPSTEAMPALLEAGFQRSWDDSIYLYELRQ
jgi:GNAT superfamily N-acetyltransferase